MVQLSRLGVMEKLGEEMVGEESIINEDDDGCKIVLSY